MVAHKIDFYNPIWGYPKSINCRGHWAFRNDYHTKCGGFDKLNHRNTNLLDSPPVRKRLLKPLASVATFASGQGAVPKVMSRRAQEPLVEMTATLNVVISINSTTVMQTYWTVPTCECFCQPLSFFLSSRIFIIKQFFYKINFMFDFQKLEFRAI